MHTTAPAFSKQISRIQDIIAKIVAHDRLLRGLNIASLVVWALYYLLIGGYGAVASMVIGLAVAVTSEMRLTRLSHTLLAIEILAIPTALLLAGPLEAVPLLGGVMFSGGVALFAGSRLTLSFLAGEVIWLVYALLIGAALGALSAFVVILALLGREALRKCRQGKFQHPPSGDRILA